MVKSFLKGGSWQAWAWEDAVSVGKVSQDSYVAVELDDRVRVAAIDGATPGYESSSSLGVNSAVWAAAVTRTAFLSEVSLETAALRANEFLLATSSGLDIVPPPRAAFAAVDVEGSRMTCVRGGDCVVWVYDGNRWESVFPLPMLSDATISPYEEWRAAHTSADSLEVAIAEDEFFADASAFRTTPLGRFADPKLEMEVRDQCPVIVLASDGAKLSLSVIECLGEWMDGLRHWEEATYIPTAGGKVHDDVTVIRLELN